MTIKDTDLDRNLSYVGKKRMKNNRIVSIGARQNSKRRRWTTSSWSSQMAIIITSIGKSCCSNVANVFFVFSLNYTAHHNRFGSSKLLWRLRRWSVRRTKKMGKCPMFITNWTLDNNQSHVFFSLHLDHIIRFGHAHHWSSWTLYNFLSQFILQDNNDNDYEIFPIHSSINQSIDCNQY